MWTNEEAKKMLHKFVRQYHRDVGKNPGYKDCFLFFCHFHNGQRIPVVEVLNIINEVRGDLEKDSDTVARIEDN